MITRIKSVLLFTRWTSVMCKNKERAGSRKFVIDVLGLSTPCTDERNSFFRCVTGEGVVAERKYRST